MISRQSFTVIVTAALAVVLLGVVGLQGQQTSGATPTRVAVVDVQKVFSSLDEKADVEADIVQQTERLQQEEQQRQAEIRALQADLGILSPESEAYQQTRDKLEMKAIEFQTWKQFNQKQLDREKALRIEGLYNKVIQAVQSVATKSGYDLVLQKDNTQDLQANDQQQLTAMILQRKVLYADGELDITDQVIQVSNNEYNNRGQGGGN